MMLGLSRAKSELLSLCALSCTQLVKSNGYNRKDLSLGLSDVPRKKSFTRSMQWTAVLRFSFIDIVGEDFAQVDLCARTLWTRWYEGWPFDMTHVVERLLWLLWLTVYIVSVLLLRNCIRYIVQYLMEWKCIVNWVSDATCYPLCLKVTLLTVVI